MLTAWWCVISLPCGQMAYSHSNVCLLSHMVPFYAHVLLKVSKELLLLHKIISVLFRLYRCCKNSLMNIFQVLLVNTAEYRTLFIKASLPLQF